MFEEAKEKGVGIVARTALESGFLGGKYAPGHAFLKEGDHRARWGNKRLRRILEDGQRLSDWTVAPPYETLAQVAIQFALEPDVVSSVVVGARSAVQIAGSTEAAMLPGLGPDVQERLIAEHRGGDEAFNTGEDVD